jgi:NDP-sugar pyrophosphorylase family protein
MICTKEYNIEKWQVDEQTQVNVHIVKQEQVINDVQIIIPMSGVGQRFIDAGYKDPKPLIMVDDKPIIEHVLSLFTGEKDVTFICNEMHLKNTNMKQVLNAICPTGRIFDVPNDGREGPVHAVSLVFDKIDDNKEVIVSYCDYGTDWNYDAFLKDTRSRDADGAVACYKGFHPHMLGTDNYAFLRETTCGTRWMDCIQEKNPFTYNRMNEWASNGTYYFKTGAIMKKYFQLLMDLKQKVKNEYYVSMVYNLMVEDNLKVSIFEIQHMLQWGTPYDLEVYKDWSNYFKNITKKQKSYKDTLNTTLILPMAGAGSRFSKMGYLLPKPLIDVNGLPMIIQAVNCLPDTSHKVFICLEEHLKTYSGLQTTLECHYNNCNVIPINGITEGQACTTEIGVLRGNINMEEPCLISACDNGVYYDKDEFYYNEDGFIQGDGSYIP